MDSAEQNNNLNQAVVKDGVMTVTIYLDGKPAAFAEAIGSLVLAQDIVKGHYQQRAVQEMINKKKNGIIRPGLVN
jgi:hypothetical protein